MPSCAGRGVGGLCFESEQAARGNVQLGISRAWAAGWWGWAWGAHTVGQWVTLWVRVGSGMLVWGHSGERAGPCYAQRRLAARPVTGPAGRAVWATWLRPGCRGSGRPGRWGRGGARGSADVRQVRRVAALATLAPLLRAVSVQPGGAATAGAAGAGDKLAGGAAQSVAGQGELVGFGGRDVVRAWRLHGVTMHCRLGMVKAQSSGVGRLSDGCSVVGAIDSGMVDLSLHHAQCGGSGGG